MDWYGVVALVTLAGVIAVLALRSVPEDLVLVGALAFLMVVGVLTPAEALLGFSNEGVITIGALCIVAGGMRDTGAIQWVGRFLLGHPRSTTTAQLRMIAPTAVLSAFMNNTAVVAMFIPFIQSWAKRLRIPPSKFLLPLSYAAILGGTCTLIGTSTNLAVSGMLEDLSRIELGLFEIAKLGVPLLLVCGAFLVLFGSRLLPDRSGVDEELELVREYGVEMEVVESSSLAGKTIVDAGLRSLGFGYLAEIERNGKLMTAVQPDRVLQPHDRLYFIGAPECANELRKLPGLKPADAGAYKLELANHQRCLVEVVVGAEFESLGLSIKEGRFRSRFNAVVLSVSREGKRVSGKLGDIDLRIGDTLLLEASQEFLERYRYRRDFLLVSELNDSTPPDFRKAPFALSVLASMVLLTSGGFLPIVEASLIAAGAMIVTGCITVNRARESLNLPMLVTIAAAFGLGNALVVTGASDWVVHGLMLREDLAPWATLVLIYVLTALLTEVITNNASAVLTLPIAVTAAERLDVSALPFAIAVMFAASASFLTPLGYQTNLMVLGPGRYQFSDYIRLGTPLALISGAMSCFLIPVLWPF